MDDTKVDLSDENLRTHHGSEHIFRAAKTVDTGCNPYLRLFFKVFLVFIYTQRRIKIEKLI
jgi:hypothetical protein